jgi:hypothetical protein
VDNDLDILPISAERFFPTLLSVEVVILIYELGTPSE